MFKTETELQLELFPQNWTETETEIISGTEISLTQTQTDKGQEGVLSMNIWKCPLWQLNFEMGSLVGHDFQTWLTDRWKSSLTKTLHAHVLKSTVSVSEVSAYHDRVFKLRLEGKIQLTMDDHGSGWIFKDLKVESYHGVLFALFDCVWTGQVNKHGSSHANK